MFRKEIQAITNRRLQRFRERLMPFTFDVEWRAGKTNLIADAFSRSPVGKPTLEDHDALAVRRLAACDASIFQDLQHAAKSTQYQALVSLVRQKSNFNSLPVGDPNRRFLSVANYLSLSEDEQFVIYDGSKLLVPISAVPSVIKQLHQSHCGYVKTCLLYTSDAADE